MKDNVCKNKGLVHVSFEIGLFFKGINGLMEILGGTFLLFLSQYRLNRLTHFLTHRRLFENHNNIVANSLITLGKSFSVNTQHFVVFYLMSHGILKCILIYLLWRKKLWAYPLTIVSLLLFIAYQLHRFTITHSVFLILLTIFDAAIILLTYLEYKRIKFSN